MVSFFVYDLAFLILFSLGTFLFLRRRQDELSKEGWIFMWRTQFGVKAISWFAKKFGWIMRRMKWLIIGIGGILMGAMVWMLGQTVAIYLFHPEVMKLTKAPPIAPLIPYFPKLFGMESFFPPFYFTYFIVALAIVAIAHEFSHGVFMRLFKVKIKSTGLVFLGPILGAFVEQSERSMSSKNKVNQMTILAAGVFANVLIALLFYLLYVAFFFSSFAASGYVFDSYGAHEIPLSSIENIGKDLGLMSILLGGKSADMNISEVNVSGRTYLMSTNVKDFLLKGVDIGNRSTVILEKAPAVLAGMRGAIVQADDVEILRLDDLRWFLENKNPGDIVRFVTEDEEGVNEYDIMLSEHPDGSGRAYLGIGHNQAEPRGIIQKVLSRFMDFKEYSTRYTPTWDGDFVYFIYHLLWWVMVINLLVALFNMMPLGMLDGGRFFYLAVLGIFGSERLAKRSYQFATYLILFMFALMMFFWFIRII
jgi:membrane-associated protease RseP (regulator of RpoE activity)